MTCFEERIMIKWNYLFLTLSCLSLSSCATLFTAQNFVLIDERVTEDFISRGPGKGTIYSIPEKRWIRKIRILGEGKVKDIEIYVRVDKNAVWERVKQIKRKVDFPLEFSLAAHTDAVRITSTGKALLSSRNFPKGGWIQTVEFYTVTSGD